ncbi:MAG: IS5 family transposase [Thaumarchaeota archaeon]|nr:IS5 family transposase [Nitrososphaerota archaeon]MCL5317098.1 IS5 family transposase [Nitrososphaerota archaeon]
MFFGRKVVLLVGLVTKKKRNWREYNEELVRRGEICSVPIFLSSWSRELECMNEGKEGARYLYPVSFVKLLATIHAYILPYRQLEGFVSIFAKHVKDLRVPDYTTMWHRVSKVSVKLDEHVDRSKDVTIAVDSTGIKVSNRGEWIRQKWKVRRGFIKIHLAVDVKTKQIISMQVTREDVPDGRMLKPLLDEASSKVKVVKAVADGAYDSKDNFRYLDNLKIEPVIKVRRNSSLKAKGCMPRKLVVQEQLKDYDSWRKKHRYGDR